HLGTFFFLNSLLYLYSRGHPRGGGGEEEEEEEEEEELLLLLLLLLKKLIPIHVEKARGHLLINKLPRNMVSIRKTKKKSEERKKGKVYLK
ncbi:MAG: hypothetical protein AAFP19_27275, partial [Bacteroidota bacterium]